MADSKYGRLFTEEDVRGMLVQAACWAMDDLNATVTAGDITDRTIESYRVRFPPDEPLFLLRGQDKAAPRAIADDVDGEADYLRAARAAGASPEHLRAVEQAAHAMREWQAQHPGRVKVPD